jgi:hypothetical protein
MNAFANLLNSLGLWAALPLALLLGLLTWGAARLCALLWEDRLAPSAEAAAVGFHAVLATLMLLLVLTLVQASTVWREAHARTAREAAGMTALDRSLLSFANEFSYAARGNLHGYAEGVVNIDWPALRAGLDAPEMEGLTWALAKAARLADPQTARQQALLPGIVAHVDTLEALRQERVEVMRHAQNAALLAAMAVLALLLPLCALVMPNARVRSADLGLKAAVAGLLLGLVLASLNPYRGALSVSVAPLAEALSAMKARR